MATFIQSMGLLPKDGACEVLLVRISTKSLPRNAGGELAVIITEQHAAGSGDSSCSRAAGKARQALTRFAEVLPMARPYDHDYGDARMRANTRARPAPYQNQGITPFLHHVDRESEAELRDLYGEVGLHDHRRRKPA